MWCSLLVALDNTLGSYRCVIGVLPGRAAGAALPEQIPALVERHLDLSEARQLVVGETRASVGPFQLVLLVGELVDPTHDLVVIHGETSLFDVGLRL